MRSITGIIVHCSATRANWMLGSTTSAKVAEIKRWHVVDRGWRDIGYHYLIDRDGTIATGRPLDQNGAHVRGHNTGTIGICLIGGHGSSETEIFSDNFTPDQDKAARKLISDLQGRFGSISVTGHNQYAAKACPGFHAPTWFNLKPVAVDNPEPKETAPSGFLAALVAVLTSIFGGKK